MTDDIRTLVEAAWDDRELLKESETQKAIRLVIDLLDKGRLRVAEPNGARWITFDWIKKAVILYFPIQKLETIQAGPLEFYDKIPLKKDY